MASKEQERSQSNCQSRRLARVQGPTWAARYIGRFGVKDAEKSGLGDGKIEGFCSVLVVELGDEKLSWFTDDGLGCSPPEKLHGAEARTR
ncbi:hypothetical protein KC19_VG111300 [Ceratodon purpureus]|uniref:Uncharacterized protein n=1 Tax=Ceratodon purpureus TaxID=3225 RepID=A0A8T0HPU6_CERPU|nr:hypothetical protein KC19_VG111300 [Ceratodon purpureus]